MEWNFKNKILIYLMIEIEIDEIETHMIVRNSYGV